MRRVVVVGTGTGIGKTYVACCLARSLAALSGAPVLGLKPIETGISTAPDLAPPSDSDAFALEAASFHVKHPRPHPFVRFAEPISPHLAARMNQKTLVISDICGSVANAELHAVAPSAATGTDPASTGAGSAAHGVNAAPGRNPAPAWNPPPAGNPAPARSSAHDDAWRVDAPPHAGNPTQRGDPPHVSEDHRASTHDSPDATLTLAGGALVPTSVIELAGGLFSPLGRGTTNFDLACALDPALWVLVAPDALGVLHDVTACLEAMRARGREPDAIVLSAAREPDASSGTNAAEIVTLGIAPECHRVGRGEALADSLARDLLARTALP